MEASETPLLARLFSPGLAIIAHRGASAYAGDNTIEAYRLAAEQGADGVEIDVRRTADDALIIHHDSRQSDVGTFVELDQAQIREYAPLIPTLDEALEATAGMFLNVEIKNSPGEPDFDPGDSVATAIARWVRDQNLHDRVIVSSFNPATINRIKELDATIATGWLTTDDTDPVSIIPVIAGAGHNAIHPAIASLEGDKLTATMSQANAAGLAVATWTVDDPVAIRRLAAAGCHGVFTNDPSTARAALSG